MFIIVNISFFVLNHSFYLSFIIPLLIFNMTYFLFSFVKDHSYNLQELFGVILPCKDFMEELLTVFRGCYSPINNLEKDINFHREVSKLEGVISDYHQQTMQWNQFMRT